MERNPHQLYISAESLPFQVTGLVFVPEDCETHPQRQSTMHVSPSCERNKMQEVLSQLQSFTKLDGASYQNNDTYNRITPNQEMAISSTYVHSLAAHKREIHF
jgi:hypothetical protein